MDPAATAGAALENPVETPSAKTRFTRKERLLAWFVTWHLVAVIIYVAPYPPALDDVALSRPENQEEMQLLFRNLRPFTPWWHSEQEVQTNVLRIARGYTSAYFLVRSLFEPYLDLTGSTQTWNMFGGTPPRYPSVFMAEILPRGESQWVLFQDMNWGSDTYKAIHYRHFETQGNMSAGGWDKHREWYAMYWARRWNALHPDRPAGWVKTYYLRLTTPSAESVRRGDNDRRPPATLEWSWPVPHPPKP